MLERAGLKVKACRPAPSRRPDSAMQAMKNVIW